MNGIAIYRTDLIVLYRINSHTYLLVSFSLLLRVIPLSNGNNALNMIRRKESPQGPVSISTLDIDIHRRRGQWATMTTYHHVARPFVCLLFYIKNIKKVMEYLWVQHCCLPQSEWSERRFSPSFFYYVLTACSGIHCCAYNFLYLMPCEYNYVEYN